MKKKPLFLVALTLTMALLLTACNNTQSGDASGSAEPSMIENVLEQSGTAVNGAGSRMEYSYAVPHLNLDTPGAVSINQRIDTELGSYVQKQMELAGSEEGLALMNVCWHEYRNEDLLSLVIKAEYSDKSLSYYVYNYDMESGAELDNTALLTHQQQEPAKFEQALRQAVAMEFDRQALKQQDEEFDAVQLMRMDAISAANLSLEHIQLFVEEMQLKAVVHMMTPVVGDSDNKVVTVMQEPEQEPVQKTVEKDFITATLDQNTVTLTFKETENSKNYMHPVVEYDQPYTVEGLYNHYTDIALGVLGENFAPYLFLTDENGEISFCNIMGCMNAGNRFVAVGPIGLSDAVLSCEEVSDGAASTVMAQLKSGKKVNMSEYTDLVEKCAMLPMKASGWSSAEDEKYWMDLYSGWDYPLVWGEVGSDALTNGWLAYAGMTEQGGIYRFVANLPSGNKTGGYLTLARDSFNVNGNGEFWLEVTVGSGESLPGVPVGSTLKMTRTYG